MTNHRHDRDPIIDRMLAGMAYRPEEPAGPCLDAETLAAWADNALDEGELSAAEAHAADCGRCQAMLAAMAKTVPSSPAATVHSRSIPSLRWLVPLTAAAAAATIWMVVPMRQGPVTVRQVSQITEPVQPPAASVPAPDAVAPSNEKAASEARRAREAPAQSQGVQADQQRGVSSNDNAAGDTQARGAGARLESAPDAEAPVSAAASPPSQPAARTFSFGATDTEVVSSSPASRWRILPGGAVQRSSDGGATWQTQSTGVSERLSAGASPSPSVCWLVGPGGIVLLSTDGRSWTRLPFPEVVPLVTVRAPDDRTATVTTADGREWATEDGGRTWARAPGR